LKKLLFFLLGFYAAVGQADTTVICMPCNQITEDLALVRLKNSIGKEPFRIVHIGDSHIQIGHFAKQIRDVFAAHVTLTGTGISFPYSMAKSVDGPWFKSKASGTWVGDKILSANPKIDLGLTGYSVMTQDSAASISFQLRDSKANYAGVRVWFNSDSLSFFPDLGDNFNLMNFTQMDHKMGVAHFVAKNRFDQFELKLLKKDSLDQSFQLHGIELLNSQGSLDYHALGVAGAQFSHLIYRSKSWREQLKLLNPNLLIFSYGTNEAYNTNFDSAVFVNQVSRFMDEIRQILPSVAILLTSPPDTRSQNRIPPKQVEVIQGLSNVKSAFYDMNKVMGGFGSYQPWIEHNYFLKDKLHLNKAGYELQADLFMLALLGQLQPSWDLSNLKTRVEVQANALVRKIVVDSLNKDTLVSTPPVEILYHRVKKGESFFSIAKRYKLNVDALVRRNSRHKSKALQVGDRIRIN
jgi:lysophospholipase L1-like esterase